MAPARVLLSATKSGDKGEIPTDRQKIPIRCRHFRQAGTRRAALRPSERAASVAHTRATPLTLRRRIIGSVSGLARIPGIADPRGSPRYAIRSPDTMGAGPACARMRCGARVALDSDAKHHTLEPAVSPAHDTNRAQSRGGRHQCGNALSAICNSAIDFYGQKSWLHPFRFATRSPKIQHVNFVQPRVVVSRARRSQR